MTSYEQIQQALSFVPAHDREIWVRMGMAVKSELGEDGFPLWDEWSRTADNYKPNDARDVWRSLKPNGGVTIGSLLHEAKVNGYQGDGNYRKPQEDAAARAKAIWGDAPFAPDDHPYLFRKGIRSYGLRIYRGPLEIAGMDCDGALLVPIDNANGELQSLEFISPRESADNKRFLPKGKKAGNFYLIGDPGNVILVSEGYADAASLYEATSYASVVAFDAGNIKLVVETLRSRYPNARILACVDNDDAGAKTGRSLSGIDRVKVTPPPEGFKDFDEFYRRSGTEAAESYVKSALEGLGDSSSQSGESSLVVRCVADVETVPVEWLWKDRIALGKITFLVGDPDEGKSYLATALAAHVTNGTPWPDGAPCERGSVLIISAEETLPIPSSQDSRRATLT